MNANEIKVLHRRKNLEWFKHFIDQLGYRLNSVNKFLDKSNIDPKRIDYFIDRGGYLRLFISRIYEVDEIRVKNLSKKCQRAFLTL